MAEDERRAEPRILSANLINYRELSSRRTDLAPEDRIYAVLETARTVDLSGGGCRIRCREPIPVGAELGLSLQLGEHVVDCTGTVCHLDEVGDAWDAGIEFDELDDLARDGIRIYLSFKEEGGGGARPE